MISGYDFLKSHAVLCVRFCNKNEMKYFRYINETTAQTAWNYTVQSALHTLGNLCVLPSVVRPSVRCWIKYKLRKYDLLHNKYATSQQHDFYDLSWPFYGSTTRANRTNGVWFLTIGVARQKRLLLGCAHQGAYGLGRLVTNVLYTVLEHTKANSCNEWRLNVPLDTL